MDMLCFYVDPGVNAQGFSAHRDRHASAGLGKATTAWDAARAGIAGHDQMQFVWGVWKTIGLVARGQGTP